MLTTPITTQRKPDPITRPNYPEPTAEFAEDMECKWNEAREDSTLIFAVTGEYEEIDATIAMARGWALRHVPRISVIKYNHPEPEGNTEYFMLKEYRPRGKGLG